jgi:hypothetical protein
MRNRIACQHLKRPEIGRRPAVRGMLASPAQNYLLRQSGVHRLHGANQAADLLRKYGLPPVKGGVLLPGRNASDEIAP